MSTPSNSATHDHRTGACAASRSGSCSTGSRAVSASSVELCRERGDGFDAGFYVPPKRSWILVSALGLEQNGRDALFAEMGERRVSQLVKRPSSARLAERPPGHLIRKPTEPGCVEREHDDRDG